PQEVEPWLAKLDQDLQRMQAQAPTEGVSEALHEAGLPPTLLGETFGTLSWFTAWRDSDEDVRQHPAFQARMFRAADALARRTVVMADWMEGVDRAQRRAIGALLSRPNRLMAVLDHVLIRKGERMNPARRRALRGTLGDIARATRQAGAKPEALFDELILAVDHTAREEGVDRHALAAQERAKRDHTAPTSATMETVEEPSWREKWFDDPDDTVRLGLRLMGLALGVAAAGLIITVIVEGLFSMLSVGVGIAAILCFVIAPLLLLTGLVLVIVGRVRRKNHPEETDEEALLYLLDLEDPLSPLPA
ncbi:MAG: hypothetical protein RIT28_2276, partial [Pseudomonadota bacterium]